MDYDAKLDEWVVVFGSVVMGRIYGDRKGRWPDGRGIATSMVVTPLEGVKQGDVIATLNSRYLLGRPASVN